MSEQNQQQDAYIAQPAPQAPAFTEQPAVDYSAAQAPRKGLAIAALVTGIVAFLAILFIPVGAILGVAAIVLAIIAAVTKQSKGMWITGLVLGVLAIIGTIVVGLLVVAFIGMLASPELQQQLIQDGMDPQQLQQILEMLEIYNS